LLLFAGKKRQQLWFRVLFLFLTYIATSALACFIISGISGFLFNTSVNFDFNDILTFDLRSVFIFFTLFLLFCSVILLHYLMISLVGRLRLRFKTWFAVSIAFIIIATIAAWLVGIGMSMFLPVALYLLVMQFVFSRYFYSNKSVYLILNLIFAAGLTTFALNEAVSQKQNDQMKLLSLNLATEQDPLTEDILGDVIPNIASDTFLLNNPYKKDRGFNITQYLKRNYFDGYLNQYLLQVTWCHADEDIIVQPANTAVSCIDFFGDIAFKMGIPTLADEVVFINDGSGRGYYLCTIELNNGKDSSSIFAELIPASYEKGLGYPDLLVDVNSGIKTIPTGISYARYLDDLLISRYGKYNYPTRMSMLFKAMPNEIVYHEGGQVHFRSQVSDNLVLVLTQNDRNFSSFLAPFSYILLFFGLLSLLFVVSTGKVFGFRIRLATTFSSRLQWMIVLIILVIFFVAGIIAVFNLSSLNKNKNDEIVSEKAHSLIVELEHKLNEYNELSNNDEVYLTELLLKFSRVFFTDLNIYSLDGRLLSTTRPQIFEKQLVSDRMDAQAFNGLSLQNNSFLLQTETIGKMNFLSAYIPVRNSNNSVIAYLNLPFFARGNELNREISSFISTFINIYMLIILFTVLITILLSNYVTHPLRMIKDKLRTIKLGTTNEKILWKRRDEIGDLVFEYNRMIEELAFKAELLARNEREMAWREMAKQVAHEIKNPLTPMKLSTQYLEKAWGDKAADFDERLKRFAQTMTEQIDSLSDIATAFSNFGKMPESTVVRICINDVLGSVVTLYRSEEYDISLHIPDTALYVMADESQMLRVFNNLIKNAQQAFVVGRRGNVDVSLKSEKGIATVIVSDNGIGISPDLQKKIFQPNFTTKSSGTGLGLAMVKNIVDGFGGKITFVSVENSGTTFNVDLPLAE
jgi:signal transduction histidine kinase